MLPPSARENVVFEVLNNTVATSIFRYYGKGFLEKGQQLEVNFRGLFHTIVIFSTWTQISRIFILSREAFLPSVLSVCEYDYINAAGGRAPDHSLNYLLLTTISFLKSLKL